MNLLIDTDAFCKLSIAGLLSDATAALGYTLEECGRLPALTYMLRSGQMRESFGPDVCDAMLPTAEAMPCLAPPTAAWLDHMAPIDGIDPGEAQLFAAAAEQELMVLTGDKRALRNLKAVEGLPTVLANRIVVIEAVLIELCHIHGHKYVKDRIGPMVSVDKAVLACFSKDNQDPTIALHWYYQDLVSKVQPLVLWVPQSGEDG